MKLRLPVLLGLASLGALDAGVALAQYPQQSPQYANYGAPSLLPLPQVNTQWNYPSTGYPATTQVQYHSAAYAPTQPPAPPSEAVQSPMPEQYQAPQGGQPMPQHHGGQAEHHYGAPQPAGPMLGQEGAGQPCYGNGYGEGYGVNGGACDNWGGDAYLSTSCSPRWFGGVYALYMTRDDSNHLCFSYDTNDLNYQPLTSRSIDWDWQGGVEARFGRMFGCYCGLEAVYWGLFDDSQVAQVWDSDVDGDLGTSLAFNDLNFGPDNVTDWTNGAETYRLYRNYETHNIELNLIRFGMNCGGLCGPYGYGCGSECGGTGLCLSGAAGVRFFRFDDGFSFQSSETSSWADPDDTMQYDVQVENNLIGFQLGGRADYCCTSRFSMFSDVKFGLFANYMDQSQYVIDGHGNYATINNGPNQGRNWDIDSDKTDISMLGELRIGGAYQITRCWRAVGAYRAVAVSGIALSTEQVPVNFGDYYGAQNIDSNGSLLLHGVQLGLECAF